MQSSTAVQIRVLYCFRCDHFVSASELKFLECKHPFLKKAFSNYTFHLQFRLGLQIMCSHHTLCFSIKTTCTCLLISLLGRELFLWYQSNPSTLCAIVSRGQLLYLLVPGAQQLLQKHLLVWWQMVTTNPLRFFLYKHGFENDRVSWWSFWNV